MAKVRVYELARELGLESKVLVGKIREMGITVASHQSSLDDREVEKVRSLSKAAKSKSKVVVRRRKKAVEPAPAIEESVQSTTASLSSSSPSELSVTSSLTQSSKDSSLTEETLENPENKESLPLVDLEDLAQKNNDSKKASLTIVKDTSGSDLSGPTEPQSEKQESEKKLDETDNERAISVYEKLGMTRLNEFEFIEKDLVL